MGRSNSTDLTETRALADSAPVVFLLDDDGCDVSIHSRPSASELPIIPKFSTTVPLAIKSTIDTLPLDSSSSTDVGGQSPSSLELPRTPIMWQMENDEHSNDSKHVLRNMLSHREAEWDYEDAFDAMNNAANAGEGGTPNLPTMASEERIMDERACQTEPSIAEAEDVDTMQRGSEAHHWRGIRKVGIIFALAVSWAFGYLSAVSFDSVTSVPSVPSVPSVQSTESVPPGQSTESVQSVESVAPCPSVASLDTQEMESMKLQHKQQVELMEQRFEATLAREIAKNEQAISALEARHKEYQAQLNSKRAIETRKHTEALEAQRAKHRLQLSEQVKIIERQCNATMAHELSVLEEKQKEYRIQVLSVQATKYRKNLEGALAEQKRQLEMECPNTVRTSESPLKAHSDAKQNNFIHLPYYFAGNP